MILTSPLCWKGVALASTDSDLAMLRIHRVKKTYDDKFLALHRVNLDIGKGMFGLLGPNGAGKSTLMRIICGLLLPDEGQKSSVEFNGIDILSHPAEIQERLGYLPQDYGLYPHLSGQQMLAHLVELKGIAYGKRAVKVAVRLLSQVGLKDAASRKVRGYSGGMRQRLGIAQALAGDPELLVLDEPTVGLDPEERSRFYKILARLAEDRTVILSTHYVGDVANLCREFALLHEGRILASTSPEAAVQSIQGCVFEGSGDFGEGLGVGSCVTQEFFFAGEPKRRVFVGDGVCPGGMEPVVASLEDAYVAALRAGHDLSH